MARRFLPDYVPSESPETPIVQYFANAVGGVHFLPNAFVYLHWSGAPMTTPEFCALYIHARNLLRRNGLKRVLADHRRMPPIQDEHKEWLLREWLPETVAQTGYERCAVLRSEQEHRLHTVEFIRELEQVIEIRLFDDMLDAGAWLRDGGKGAQ